MYPEKLVNSQWLLTFLKVILQFDEILSKIIQITWLEKLKVMSPPYSTTPA